MKREMVAYTTDDITTLIITVRGKRVILDRDLAALYGVPTFRFNEAVKRNRKRFPEDFMFQLTGDEAACLTSQIAMSNRHSLTGRNLRPVHNAPLEHTSNLMLTKNGIYCRIL